MTGSAVILGKGFIGSALTEHLKSRRYIVRAFTSSDCNLLIYSQLEQALDAVTDIDALIITSSITRLTDNSRSSFLQNATMTDHVARYLEQRKINKVIFLSSVDVYGLIAKENAITEDFPFAPDDFYSLSKVTSEFMLQRACANTGTALTIFRLCGVFGPGDMNKSTISRMVQAARKDKQILLEQGAGELVRCFLWIEDVNRYIELALLNNVSGVFNLAPNQSYKLKEVAQMVAERLPFNVSIKTSAVEPANHRALVLKFETVHLTKHFPMLAMTSLPDAIAKYVGGQ